MLEIATNIAKENKEKISKLSISLGMEFIFERLLEKFGDRLGEITIAKLDGFRMATVHAYETIIENE